MHLNVGATYYKIVHTHMQLGGLRLVAPPKPGLRQYPHKKQLGMRFSLNSG